MIALFLFPQNSRRAAGVEGGGGGGGGGGEVRFKFDSLMFCFPRIPESRHTGPGRTIFRQVIITVVMSSTLHIQSSNTGVQHLKKVITVVINGHAIQHLPRQFLDVEVFALCTVRLVVRAHNSNGQTRADGARKDTTHGVESPLICCRHHF